MIGGQVYVDLRREPEDESRDRRRLAVLSEAPTGARVMVDIGGRRFIDHGAAAMLKEHGARLTIDIIGTDPIGVQTVVAVARAGSWSGF